MTMPVITNNHAKEHSRNRWVVAIAALILVAVLVITGAILFIRLTNSNTKPTPTWFASPKAIIAKLAPTLKGKQLRIVSANGMGGITLQGYAAYTFPPYQVDKRYQTMPATGDGLGIESSSDVSMANYRALSDFFVRHHFDKLAATTGKSLPVFLSERYDFMVKEYAVYDSETIRCVLSRTDASSLQPSSAIASVGCADKSQYKEVARAIAPLYEAYIKSEGSEANILFGMPIERQGSDGYWNMTVYQEIDQGDSSQGPLVRKGLYYESPHDNSVTFFMQVAGTPDCTAFNTNEIVKAFKGYECYDEVKNIYTNV